MKFLVKHVGSGGTPDSSVEEFYCEDGVKWVAIGDMSTVEYVSDTEKKLTKIGIANKNLEIYPEGTILYSIYASIGKVSELKVPATINQAILAIFVDENQINKSYFKRYLYAVESKVMEDVSTNTQSNLNLFKVLNFDVPLPSMSEQVEISNYLDKKLNEINEIIKQKQKAVDKIYEYKKSLIYEYVTGKKRVEVK